MVFNVGSLIRVEVSRWWCRQKPVPYAVAKCVQTVALCTSRLRYAEALQLGLRLSQPYMDFYAGHRNSLTWSYWLGMPRLSHRSLYPHMICKGSPKESAPMAVSIKKKSLHNNALRLATWVHHHYQACSDDIHCSESPTNLWSRSLILLNGSDLHCEEQHISRPSISAY